MKKGTPLLWIIFLLFAAPIPRAAAQGLTLENVTELLQLGYTEDEIEAEIREKGIAFDLDAAAEAALRKAGAGETLLAFLRSRPSGPPLDMEALLGMIREKRPLAEILEKIAASRVQGPPGEETAKKLAEASAPPPVLLALKGSPLTSDEILLLSRLPYPPEIYLRLVRITGVRKEKVPPSKALALLRAGVPKSVLRAFREGRAPGSTLGKKGLPSPVSKTPLPEGTFTHVGKRFTLRCPRGWILMRDILEGTVRYVLTPEKGKDRIEDLETGVTLTLWAPPEDSVLGEEDPEGILEKMLPLFRMEEPDMEPVGPLRRETAGGLEGASRVLEGIPRDKFTTFKAKVFMGKAGGLVYMLAAMAPEARYGAMEKAFEKVFRESRLGPPPTAARGKPVEAAALAERYKGSVVYIEAGTGFKRGQGTGFIVSREGYILTNWHVVWNTDAGKPHANFTVRWDDSLKRPDVKAVFLGAYHRLSGESLAGGTIGGTDVALLKIPAGDYEPVPLTPLSQVKLGDPVVALGFPVSYNVAGLSLFLTKGVVVRFNRNFLGKVESLTTDAKITHGNSGGPCFDLATGGVIGLNTWGYDIGTRTASGESANNFVGYYFVCPTDAALARFPLVAELGLPHDVKLDFFPTFELASLFLALGYHRAALEEADKAVEMRPRSPRALVLRGHCRRALAFEKLAEGKTAEALRLARLAEASFERAMIADPGSAEARVARAALLLDLGRKEEAAGFAKEAVRTHPRRWDALMVAARTAFALGKHKEALGYLDRAKKISRDILPDPYILAGEVAYSRGWFEEGKKEFDEAARIQPGNLAARMGVVRFHMARKAWDDALAELEKVKGRFPGRPEPVHRIAQCLLEKKDLEKALNRFMDAESMFKKAGISPPMDFFPQMARAFKEKGFEKGEMTSLAKFLLHYGATPQAVGIHLKLAALYRGKDLHALATFHVRRALSLSKELKIPGKLDTGEFQIVDPPLQAVVVLLRELRYPPRVVAELVVHCRLAYTFPARSGKAAQGEIQRLLKLGIPGIVIQAIMESNKRFPPAARAGAPGGGGRAGTPGGTTGPGGPGGAAPPPPPGPSKEAKLLLGSWRTRMVDPMGGRIEIVMTFLPNGKITEKGIMGGFKVDDVASYSVSGNTITTVIERSTNPMAVGQKMTLQFQFAGPDVLKLYIPTVRRWVTYKRIGGH